MNILIVLHDFRGGGAEKVAVRLANEMAISHKVTVACANENGPFRNDLKNSVNLINFKIDRVFKLVPKLFSLLKINNYDLVISHLTHVNVSTILASFFSGFSSKTIVVEHSQLYENYKKQRQISVKIAYLLAKVLYKFPKYVIGVSEGVSSSVRDFTFVPERKSITIYNPVLSGEFVSLFHEKPTHLFFNIRKPVFIFVGRLISSKKVDVLLNSFSLYLKKHEGNLLILGEGPELHTLIRQSENLGIADNVSFLGFIGDPYPYIKHANVLVLTSIWEGLPTVLIEALALNVQCVSTDCPSGPAEILCDGSLGYLCRVNDEIDISEKMHLAVYHPIDISDANLNRFNITAVTAQYIECVQ